MSKFDFQYEVECKVPADPKDESIEIEPEAIPTRWSLGNVNGEDVLHMAVRGGPSLLVPGENIFPPLPIPWRFARTDVTVHHSWDQEPDPDVFYLKRPWVDAYNPGSPSHDVAVWFAMEIKNMEQLSRHDPHPNLVRYHGCRVRKGRVTGLMLGRVPGGTLFDYVSEGKIIEDKPAFLEALGSAVKHLHDVVGLVHNDIHPSNIMISPDGTTPTREFPVPFLLSTPPVLPLLFESPMDTVAEKHFVGPISGRPISRKSRDLAALERLGVCIEEGKFEPNEILEQEKDEFVQAGMRLQK